MGYAGYKLVWARNVLGSAENNGMLLEWADLCKDWF
jgi:hypothetical protein